MAGFPESKVGDPEEVTTALDVGRAQFARGEHPDALKWLRKAVDAAFEAGLDGRGVELSKSAVELSPSPRKPTLSVGSVPPPVPPRARASTAAPPLPPAAPQSPAAPPRAAVPMPSAPQAPQSPPAARATAPEPAAPRRTSAAGTRRNTRGPRPEPPRESASVAPPPSARPSPPAPTPSSGPSLARVSPQLARKPASPVMRATTLELDVEEATDTAVPLPVAPVPPSSAVAPPASSLARPKPAPTPAVVAPPLASPPAPSLAPPRALTPLPVARAAEPADPDSTQVFKPTAMPRTQLHQALRVGVSRGAAGVVVRVLDGPVRTGEVEAMLVSALPNGALAELFNVK